MDRVSIKYILSSSPLKNGKHRIKVQFIKARKSTTYSLNLFCEKQDFLNERVSRKYKDYKKINKLLDELEMRMEANLRKYEMEGRDYTLKDLLSEHSSPEPGSTLFYAYMEEMIKQLIKAEKISSARIFLETSRSLRGFHSDPMLRFPDVNYGFLQKYEAHLRSQGNTDGGIAFKMRIIRIVCNDAIKNKVLEQDQYPFKDYKVAKLKSSERKIALTSDELHRFSKVDLVSRPDLKEAHRYFMFSFYCRGMNFKDMMLLKWSDVQGGTLSYTRSKTNVSLKMAVLPQVQNILDYYRETNGTSKYIFPLITQSGTLTAKQLHNRKTKTLRKFNRDLAEIAQLANIDKQITSYTARHSFATILKYKDTSVEKISEMMGHSSITVTSAYLKSFDSSDLDNEALKLDEY